MSEFPLWAYISYSIRLWKRWFPRDLWGSFLKLLSNLIGFDLISITLSVNFHVEQKFNLNLWLSKII